MRDAPPSACTCPDHGVRGNGHGIMLERNNREALGAILAWLEVNVADVSPPTEEE